MSMIKLHEEHWNAFLDDPYQKSLYDSWWHDDRVNFWRHRRLMAPVLEVLERFKTFSWMTIGDGAGTDAWMMLKEGFQSVVATDLDDKVLAVTKKNGHITDFRVENAEALKMPDNSVDFVLCKEALHHMSRPYAGIYEFFRVARYGVVIIEPQDLWIDWPCRTDESQPHYEAVGNYVYEFSLRELEKIAYGMNLTGLATRSLIDVYIQNCEFARREESDPIWQETLARLAQAEKDVANGRVKPNYIQAIFFKNPVAPAVLDLLADSYPEWKFRHTDTNPYL